MIGEVELTDKELAEARGHVSSMSSSGSKAIILLQSHAEDARKRGDDQARRAHIAKSHDVADEMAVIYDAYTRLRQRKSLNEDIAALTDITASARAEVKRVEALAEALDAASEIISLLKRLAGLVA